MAKSAAEAPVATFMQPLHYDLRLSAAKDNSITHAAAAATNLNTGAPLRYTDASCKHTVGLLAAETETAAPKPDLDAKADKDDFEMLLKRFFFGENHPAGWVFERGGLAFFHVCGFCVAWRFSMKIMIFCQVRVSIPLFFCFTVHWPSNMDSFPEKYSCFGGSFHKLTVEPWFWHVKAVLSFAPRFGHICAQVLPVKDIRKSPYFRDSQRHCHARTYVQMVLLMSDRSWELHKDDGMACFASFQQLCPQCLCGSLQFDVHEQQTTLFCEQTHSFDG